tara:strand:- start:251 stop:436 length:186 start_codon:yes stop_codon:yes gene_type:complete
MQVGDLVKVVCVDGHPMGMILEVSDHPSGYRIQQYLVQLFSRRPGERKPHQYLKHHLEVVR